MMQCQDCEFCVKDKMGRIQLRCNPFVNIKEPECLQKWMLLKQDFLVRASQTTMKYYQKFGPLQEKMLKYIEREINDVEDVDKWKYGGGDTDDDDNLDEDDSLP